jgi:hypothetical protein
MHLTFDELRSIKHRLPHGSVSKIALELGMEEQQVRDYFGAHNFNQKSIPDLHLEPGPNGGIVHLEDTRVLEAAQRILAQSEKQ